MLEDWRIALYYPLGILPSIFFSLRFFIQWLRSERVGKSVVIPLFWKLSLAGNSLLFLHYFIQLQYPFALIQAINGLIAWRNLNLMRRSQKPIEFHSMVMLIMATLGIVTIAFHLHLSHIENGSWFGAVPVSSTKIAAAPLWLHLVGISGQSLFASRFWIQWWLAEKNQKSQLPAIFWWLSLAGTVVSLAYFIAIADVVSILNNSFGIIPYVRNLVLIRRKIVLSK